MRVEVPMAAEERVQILREAKPDTWIAFSEDESRIVGYGETYQKAVEDAERNGSSEPLLVKIPPRWSSLVL